MIPKWDRMRRLYLAGGELPTDPAMLDVDEVLLQDGLVDIGIQMVRLTAAGRRKAAYLFGRPPGDRVA